MEPRPHAVRAERQASRPASTAVRSSARTRRLRGVHPQAFRDRFVQRGIGYGLSMRYEHAPSSFGMSGQGSGARLRGMSSTWPWISGTSNQSQSRRNSRMVRGRRVVRIPAFVLRSGSSAMASDTPNSRSLPIINIHCTSHPSAARSVSTNQASACPLPHQATSMQSSWRSVEATTVPRPRQRCPTASRVPAAAGRVPTPAPALSDRSDQVA